MKTETPQERQAAIEKLGSLVKKVKFAMLTTQDEDGTLRSRPMATQATDFDGTLWFFTRASAPKVDEVEQEHQVNLSYAQPDDQLFVSISGRANLVRDRAKADELWNPALKAWFPKGTDDPDLALLKVEVEKAEYWDTPNSTMVHLIGYVKATLTGESYKPGENKKITLG
jgi:general stress protein 26